MNRGQKVQVETSECVPKCRRFCTATDSTIDEFVQQTLFSNVSDKIFDKLIVSSINGSSILALSTMKRFESACCTVV